MIINTQFNDVFSLLFYVCTVSHFILLSHFLMKKFKSFLLIITHSWLKCWRYSDKLIINFKQKAALRVKGQTAFVSAARSYFQSSTPLSFLPAPLLSLCLTPSLHSYNKFRGTKVLHLKHKGNFTVRSHLCDSVYSERILIKLVRHVYEQ